MRFRIDDEVYRIYGISEEDRRLIEEELSAAAVEPEEENQYEVMPIEEHVRNAFLFRA